MSNIAMNLAAVRERIASAARAAGRRPEEIVLIAVTKGRTPAEVAAAVAAGVTDLGENRVQEAVAKVPAVAALLAQGLGAGAGPAGAPDAAGAARGPGPAGNPALGPWEGTGPAPVPVPAGGAGGAPAVRWHMIGTLQTNKVRQALGFAHLIHSLDRPSLAEALDKEARRRGEPAHCLVQVNVAGEATKHGLSPADVIPFLEQVATLPGVRVHGLMTIAPVAEDPETVRPVFAALRELAERCGRLGLPNVEMRWLSMGMSGDFEAAIREGANMVRIGTAIFGQRPRPG